MKILICDDNYNFAEGLRKSLAVKLPENVQWYLCGNGKKLMEYLSEEGSFDLLLMDICLKGDNGIQLSKTVLKRFPQTAVIFITGYPELFYETVYLSVRPYGFVKKPVNQDLLLTLVRQALWEKENNSWIYVRTTGGMKKVFPTDIRYIESQKHVLYFHNVSEILKSYGRISDISAQLPGGFLQCHKSFLINLQYVQSYMGDHFVLADGTHIGISQTRRKAVRQQFFQYLDHRPAGYFENSVKSPNL